MHVTNDRIYLKYKFLRQGISASLKEADRTHMCLLNKDLKGARWMPWHRESMKDVASCDKLRLGAHTRMTRRPPNGETRHWQCSAIPRLNQLGQGRMTLGTETSKYQEEYKSKEIAKVAASEIARA